MAADGTASSGEAISLFNGKDLSGWSFFVPKEGINADGKLDLHNVFKVKDGVIRIDGKDIPFGYMRTERDFTNYRLQLEWRWTEDSPTNNSGVFLRVTGGGADKAFPMTYEVETANIVNATVGNDVVNFLSGDFVVIGYDKTTFKTDPALIDSWGKDMDGYRGFSWMDSHRFRSADAEKPAGEWNSYDILVDDDRITVELNGVIVNQASGAEVIAGGIALQAEGADIEYRNITLTPL